MIFEKNSKSFWAKLYLHGWLKYEGKHGNDAWKTTFHPGTKFRFAVKFFYLANDFTVYGISTSFSILNEIIFTV